MEKRGDIMTKNNRRKKYNISGKRYIRACLLIVTMLLIATAAGCSRKPSEEEIEPTKGVTEALTPEPTATLEPTATPEPTVTPEPTATPEPTKTQTQDPSGTAFISSGISGHVHFTGNTVELSEAGIGDTVRFGSYEQDNDTDNGAEDIEWLVLDKQDGKLLLISKDALDAKPYHEEYIDVTWETCTLRGWLNDTFYNTAFSTEEQGRIVTTKVKNEDNLDYGTEGGNDTEDKIFLLSTGEARGYFDFSMTAVDPARQTRVTAYAKAQGGFVDNSDGNIYSGNGWWWLRTPGYINKGAAYVAAHGIVSSNGISVSHFEYVIRPVFWLNLEP